MSIDDQVLMRLVAEGSLHEVALLDAELSPVRRIFAASDLMTDIDAAYAHGGANRRLTVELRADLDDFIGGEPITVGGARHKHAYMKPMLRAKNQPGFGGHEVWEIRSRKPPPGIRLFGRFAQRDVFVATNWEVRTVLGEFGSLLWRQEIRIAKHRWNVLFGTQRPHEGVTVRDYISDPVVDLRDP